MPLRCAGHINSTFVLIIIPMALTQHHCLALVSYGIANRTSKIMGPLWKYQMLVIQQPQSCQWVQVTDIIM